MSATEYGLIGHPLGHSLSPFLHHELLTAAGLADEYHLFDLDPAEMPVNLPELLLRTGGINCTIPYKEAIIPFLAGLDESAARIGSVNTVSQGIGYNTDDEAFRKVCPLSRGDNVLLLGAGGISRTMAFAAAEAGARLWIYARRPEQAKLLAAAVRDTCQDHGPACSITCPESLSDWEEQRHREGGWIVLNGTPLGMWPETGGLPLPAEDLDACRLVFDTIYNPVATRLVLAARSRGIPASGGLDMLFHQALKAEQIWHPDDVFPENTLVVIRSKLARAILHQFPLALVLTGYMGCGKTTVGHLLASGLDLPFVDLDEVIAHESGRTIPDIFTEDGEPSFRALERSFLLRELDCGHSMVLASGGGTLVTPEALELVRRQAALILFLDASADQIMQRVKNGEGRPMIEHRSREHLLTLYEQRRPLYLAGADLVVPADGKPDEVAERIALELGFGGEIK